MFYREKNDAQRSAMIQIQIRLELQAVGNWQSIWCPHPRLGLALDIQEASKLHLASDLAAESHHPIPPYFLHFGPLNVCISDLLWPLYPQVLSCSIPRWSKSDQQLHLQATLQELCLARHKDCKLQLEKMIWCSQQLNPQQNGSQNAPKRYQLAPPQVRFVEP